MKRFEIPTTFAVAASLLAAGGLGLHEAGAQEVVEDQIRTQYETIRLVQVADGLEQPWAVAFLPGERLLVSERPGRLQIVSLPDGRKTGVRGVPEVHAVNQGGLLDVVLHPDYEENGWIYLTFSKGDSEGTVPALARARLDGDRLVDTEVIFESNEHTSPGRHYGSRILFLEDGTLLMSIGDRGAQPPRAQDSRDHSGSVVRLNPDGSVPEDNPFVDDPEYAPEIYSYGHRNIQGIVTHPGTGKIWATEHGPRGGDELNIIEPGQNYGWPVQTLGRDYRTQDAFPHAEARSKPGMVDPVFEFLPTLAPSGLTVVTGDRFPNWRGDLLAGGLRSERILRLVVEDGEVLHAEELLTHSVGRIRDVRQGPDGYIYLVTGEDQGAVYRIEPAGR